MAQRPPTPWYLGYRLLGLRLPAEYRGWVAEDTAGKSYMNWRVLRAFLWGAVVVGLYDLAQAVEWEHPGRTTLIRQAAGVAIYGLMLSRKSVVRRTLRWQRTDKHGRSVRPRGFGLLTSGEGVVAVVGAAVLLTGASAVFAYQTVRPSGPLGQPCRPPGKSTLARIKAGFAQPGAEMLHPIGVPYGDKKQAIVTYFRLPDQKSPRLVALIAEGDNIYELRPESQKNDAATTFPRPPRTIDRLAGQAINRAAVCLAPSAPR